MHNFKTPVGYKKASYIVRQLLVKDLELDYSAIQNNIKLLQQTPTPPMCGFWPTEDLSKEDDLNDLIKHEKMHSNKEMFAYTILNKSETECLGCIYIIPKKNNADVYYWITKKVFDIDLNKVIDDDIKNWLKHKWYFQKINFPGRE